MCRQRNIGVIATLYCVSGHENGPWGRLFHEIAPARGSEIPGGGFRGFRETGQELGGFIR